MKKACLLLIALIVLCLSFSSKAQNNKNIGIGTSTPDPSAILDITSADKGILVPRLNSAQINAINTPAEGLMVYNLDSNCYYYYNNFQWVSLCHVGTASNGVHIAVVGGVADYELGGPLTQNTDIPLAGKKLTFSTTGTGGNIGIGNNNPDPSSILDLTNNNNTGLLVPKVTFTKTSIAAPVALPATGLMVFNTNTQNDVTPGYYFWDGTQWMRLFSSNLPVVSTVSVTTPIINSGTAQDPNIGITTSDLTGSTVIAVSNGANRLTGAGGASLDVTGTNGGVLYGTGTSSSFTPAGASGEILKSNGAAAPTWVAPNSTLTTTNITGSPVVAITNGANQVVGVGNVSIDISGANGGLLYGTGTSALFTPAGIAGQYLRSTGAAAPAWTTGSNVTGGTVVSITNGTQQTIGAANMNVDVVGPQGTVLYGTGTSSDFTVQGNPGEILKSNGTAAPSWVSPNAALATSNLTGGSVVTVTNGTGKLVGLGGSNVDITGANGGVLYGTGTSSNFTPAGSAGQVLQSTGAGAPVWASPNATLTTNNVTGGTVVNITNGTNQVVGGTNMNVDVSGANGGVLYGTGTSSNFTPAGSSGQILKSNGAAAPTWVSPNSTLSTANVTGGTVMSITNGTDQLVGGSNMNIDVAGANGGVMYGTGTSSAFTPAGTAGQVLKSTGAGAPIWSSPNATLTTNNVVPGASSAVVVTNGTGQVVGGTNMSLDVQGTSGGVFYGKGAGTAAAFSAVGTTGQILQSNGASTPTWVNPNTALTTKNLTNAGNGVITVTSGANQLVGASNSTIDVVGTSGGILYGTGASSAFSSVGTAGQYLQSNGAGAPTWATINTTTSNLTGSSVVTITNGTNKVFGVGNAGVDVAGTAGGVLYGTGASSGFTAVGTSGQVLKSNGAAAPTWVAPASIVNVDNGLYYNAVSQTHRLGTNPLVENTTITQAGFNFSVAGGTINLNDASSNAVNIATNASAGTVSIGTGASTQTVSIANGAGPKTLALGSTNTTSATNISAGSGAINMNVNNSQPTNINNGTNSGAVNISNSAASTGTVNIGTNNTVQVTGSKVGVNVNPSQALDVAGNVKFSNALMPNNLPGSAPVPSFTSSTSNYLQSQGAGVAPTWVQPVNRVQVPLNTMAVNMTSASAVTPSNSYFVYQNGASFSQTSFAAPITPAAGLALGPTWMSAGPGIAITSNGTFSKVYGWVFSTTASRNFQVYVYKYTPVDGSLALVTPVAIGNTSLTLTTATAVYHWEIDAAVSLTKGDQIVVFYGTTNTSSAAYYFSGQMEYTTNIQ